MKNDFLENIAIESGAIEPVVETNEQLVEVLADGAVKDSGVVQTMDTAEATADIAEQLEELAERADAVAEKVAEEEKDAPGAAATLATVSAESLQREFVAIMRANHLDFASSSFEAAGSDMERLVGLSRDARRVAELNRNYRTSLLDYTEEGAIMRFIRGDEGRLDKARDALATASKRLNSSIGELKTAPVAIKHQGLARFLTREGVPVRDLARAIGIESSYLQKVHDAAQASAIAIANVADSIAAGKWSLDEHKVASSRIFGGLSELGSPPGFMMGNFTLKAEISSGPLAGLTAPKFTRVGETQLRGKDIAWGLFGALVGHLQVSAVQAVIMIGGLAVGAVMPALVAASVVGVARVPNMIYQGYKGTQNSADYSELRSQGSATDLVGSINSVMGYEKYSSYKVDADAIQAKIKAARGATAGLDSDQKKAVSKICEALETSLSRLVRLADCVYEQSLYTTVMMATLADAAINKVR